MQNREGTKRIIVINNLVTNKCINEIVSRDVDNKYYKSVDKENKQVTR